MSVQYIPPKPHFYIEKPGYAGVYLFFLFFAQNIDGSNMYPQPTVLSKYKKKYTTFSTENFQFLKFKNLCLLHGQVFVTNLTHHSGFLIAIVI